MKPAKGHFDGVIMDRVSVLKGAVLGALLCFTGGEWKKPAPVEAFRIHVLDADLEALASRLSHVRFTDSVAGVRWNYRAQSVANPRRRLRAQFAGVQVRTGNLWLVAVRPTLTDEVPSKA